MVKVTPARVKRAHRELWEQYEVMEEKFDNQLRRLSVLKKDLAGRDEMMNNLKTVLDQRDKKIEGFKARLFAAEKKIESRRTEMELMERYMAEDRSAYNAALDTISMLKRDLEVANEEVRLRDYWFSANLQLFEHLVVIQKDRDEVIRKARIRGPKEFTVDESAVILDALAELGAVESKIVKISERTKEKPLEDILVLSERSLSEELGLDIEDSMLLRRALDRIAFSELQPPDIETGQSLDGVVTIVVSTKATGRRYAKEQASIILEEPGKETAGLDAGLFHQTRSFNNGLTRIIDSAGGPAKVRVVLQRGPEDGRPAVIDNRPMLEDNNFLLGIHRVDSRGISLVPGLVAASEDEAGAAHGRLTENKFFEDVSSRIGLDPESARQLSGLEDAQVLSPGSGLSNPVLPMAMQAAVSYLKQDPLLEFEIIDAILTMKQ